MRRRAISSGRSWCTQCPAPDPMCTSRKSARVGRDPTAQVAELFSSVADSPHRDILLVDFNSAANPSAPWD